MNKFILFISFLVFNCSLIAQDKAKDVYVINDPDAYIEKGTFISSMDMKNTEEGSLEINVQGMNIKGELKEFINKVKTEDIRTKDKISRTYVTKRRRTVTVLNGNEQVDGDETEMEGKTAHFIKKGDEWELENKEDFSELALRYLTTFYSPTDLESESAIYPVTLKMGEVTPIEENSNFQIASKESPESISGTLKLLKVEKIKGERIATIEVDFTVVTTENIGTDKTKITMTSKGIIKRSIDYFYDKESDLKVEMVMDMELNRPNEPQVKLKMQFVGTMEANCEYSK